eukprot:1498893-Karenia_brevis.AAC.1
MGKSKILSNIYANSASTSGQMTVQGKKIEIMPSSGSTMYLGRLLCFANVHDTEIDNRIDKAWKSFRGLKRELCNKGYSLQARLRLFDAVITPSILYSAGTWCMTEERERKLRRTQRQMLRSIIQIPRRRMESSSTSSSGISDDEVQDSDIEADRLEPW